MTGPLNRSVRRWRLPKLTRMRSMPTLNKPMLSPVWEVCLRMRWTKRELPWWRKCSRRTREWLLRRKWESKHGKMTKQAKTRLRPLSPTTMRSLDMMEEPPDTSEAPTQFSIVEIWIKTKYLLKRQKERKIIQEVLSLKGYLRLYALIWEVKRYTNQLMHGINKQTTTDHISAFITD